MRIEEECSYMFSVIIWELGHQIKKDGFSSNDFECRFLSFLWLSFIDKGT